MQARGIIQAWLGGCEILNLRIEFLLSNLGLTKNWIVWGDVYRIEDYRKIKITRSHAWQMQTKDVKELTLRIQ